MASMKRHCQFGPKMFCWITWFTIILFATLTTTEGKHSSPSVLVEKYSVYHVKSHNPFSRLRNIESNIPANIEELISSLPYEIDISKFDRSWRRGVAQIKNRERKFHNVCHLRNVSCSQICEEVNGEAICSCQSGFSITDNGKCIEATKKETILSGTSGNFITDKKDYTWVIKAPEDHLVQCIIAIKLPKNSPSSTDRIFGNVKVYDGYSESSAILVDHGTLETREWTSSGRYLRIRISYFQNNGVLFNISYKTGAPTLVLNNEGDARIERTAPKSCYSLTYSSPNNVIMRYLDYRSGYESADFKITHDKRTTEIVRINSPGIRFNFRFRGMDTVVYSFRKCTDIEHHWASNPDAYGSGSAVGVSKSNDIEAKCLNGGSWNNATEKCLCSVGFVGKYCEEGCGPNRYGENCTAICSTFSSNCQGMIFCTEEMCSCAPGYYGINCDTQCGKGWYGASCQQKCGKCKNNETCDSYTGKCLFGCEEGFYPPMCQQTYKVLRDKPEISEIGNTYLVVDLSFKNVVGAGEPNFYQVQYKMIQDSSWSELAPRVISDKQKLNVTGLRAGKQYEVRVILIDKDGGSYQTNVPNSTIWTTCIEPQKANYDFEVKEVGANEILLKWSYEAEENSLECEIKEFVLSFNAEDDEFFAPLAELKGTEKVHGLLPDTDYSFTLMGQTVTNKSIVPTKINVRTRSAAPGQVRGVQVTVPDILNNVIISWSPPWNYEDRPLKYSVTYRCQKLLACHVPCGLYAGQIEVQKTTATLEHIKPHAIYEINILAISTDNARGEEFTTYVTTPYSASQATPTAAENPYLSLTNDSASVKWLPPENCVGLNGYLYGYSYALVDTENNHTLYRGTVPENTLYASFFDLQPRHCYEAYIAIASSGVTEFRNFIVIPFCTKSSAPDQVQSLKVYKKGPRMVGLRWGLPLNTYGDIDSFIITYRKVGKASNRTVVVEPKECVAWPNLYCHTISNLSPGRNYRFAVRARNKEVDTVGVAASVEAFTREGVSTPPKNLEVINATQNSVLLKWEIPDIINGQLRSFIIVTEQIDTKDVSDECCDEIPIEEYHVTSEERFYTQKIIGLSTASTYSVAIAAKTVSLGEAARITIHTRPPKPTLPDNALTFSQEDDCGVECDQLSFQIRSADRVNGVNRKYILLLLSNTSRTEEANDSVGINAVLHSEFGVNYHIISEFTEEEIEKNELITFEKEDLDIENEELQPQNFVLVLVQEYLGTYSIAFSMAEET